MPLASLLRTSLYRRLAKYSRGKLQLPRASNYAHSKSDLALLQWPSKLVENKLLPKVFAIRSCQFPCICNVRCWCSPA